jgi:hypothetical protein
VRHHTVKRLRAFAESPLVGAKSIKVNTKHK